MFVSRVCGSEICCVRFCQSLARTCDSRDCLLNTRTSWSCCAINNTVLRTHKLTWTRSGWSANQFGLSKMLPVPLNSDSFPGKIVWVVPTTRTWRVFIAVAHWEEVGAKFFFGGGAGYGQMFCSLSYAPLLCTLLEMLQVCCFAQEWKSHVLLNHWWRAEVKEELIREQSDRDLKEQYAWTKVTPLSAEASSRLCPYFAGDEGTLQKAHSVFKDLKALPPPPKKKQNLGSFDI